MMKTTSEVKARTAAYHAGALTDDRVKCADCRSYHGERVHTPKPIKFFKGICTHDLGCVPYMLRRCGSWKPAYGVEALHVA